MSQHFLLSRPAKTLSLAQVFRMSDAEAETMFAKVRWPETDGAPVCPTAAAWTPMTAGARTARRAFVAAPARRDFSITSGTLFASHKLPLRAYLAAIAIFCNEVKGKSALALCRDLGMSYKAAFVLCHKLREAMAEEMKGRDVGGEGKVAEVDGGYFGGYVKPAQPRARTAWIAALRNQNGKRKVVVIVRERDGNWSRPCSRREAQRDLDSSAPASPRERSSTPTKPRHGTACTPSSK